MPAWGESRIGNMIADRPDWCISRQRVWGVPIALFTHRATGELHPRSAELLDAVADAASRRTASMRGTISIRSSCSAPRRTNYEKVTDIMDVWFDSGVVHHCVSKTATRDHGAGRSVSRRLRSASRLVPQLAADVGRAARSRAVSRRADARIHDRREGPQDVEVARQRDRAAEGRRHARRRRAAPVDRGDRLRERDEPVGRDPEARRRVVSTHPQHRALPARQSGGLRSGDGSGAGRTSWSRSIAGRCGARSSCRTR